jgi:hypothetical protein
VAAFYVTYFLPTAAKSRQKMPLEDKALHPIIDSFLQGSTGFFRSNASTS